MRYSKFEIKVDGTNAREIAMEFAYLLKFPEGTIVEENNNFSRIYHRDRVTRRDMEFCDSLVALIGKNKYLIKYDERLGTINESEVERKIREEFPERRTNEDGVIEYSANSKKISA